MPYTKETMPDAVKALPAGAQDIWIAAFNAAFVEYKGDEGKAAATAWSAVEKAGYAKNEKGEWVKTETHTEDKGKAGGEEKKDPPKKEEHGEAKEDFKEYEGVLTAVALLGQDIPAVKTLADITALGKGGDAEIEVFARGYHNGKWYGLDYLDRAVKQFEALKDRIKPPLKLGHGKQDLLQSEGLPAGGWVRGLRRAGDKLVALCSGVPEKVRELVRDERYLRVSSEFDQVTMSEDKIERRQSLWLFAEPDKKRGGDKRMEKFTEDEVKLREEEVREATEAKFRDELAKAKLDAKATAKKLEVLEAAGQASAVKAFTENLTKDGFAPAVAGMAAEIFAGLDSTTPEKFAEGKVEKTKAEYFADLMGEVVKKAKDKSLFVGTKEVAPGTDHKNFQEKDADADQKEIDEMVGTVQPKKAEKK